MLAEIMCSYRNNSDLLCGRLNYANERDILEYVITAHRIRARGFFS